MQKVFGSRYEIITPLGRGGMATVFRARDQRLLRQVALKVLTQSNNEQGQFYFHREARAIASLSHGNIVQIYDYSGPEERPSYIVMQLIEGENLERLMRERHPLPEPVLVAIAKQIAAALAHAHAKGVIHRDLKPSNAMLEPSGRVLLTDFGLAKGYSQDSLLGQTLVGQKTQLFGTPDFMAPEQLRRQDPGPHTDVFSLATMIHYLAAGELPFYHSDLVGAMKRIIAVEYDRLSVARPDLSPELVALLESCFARDASRRPAAAKLILECNQLLARDGWNDVDHILRSFLEGTLDLGQRGIGERSSSARGIGERGIGERDIGERRATTPSPRPTPAAAEPLSSSSGSSPGSSSGARRASPRPESRKRANDRTTSPGIVAPVAAIESEASAPKPSLADGPTEHMEIPPGARFPDTAAPPVSIADGPTEHMEIPPGARFPAAALPPVSVSMADGPTEHMPSLGTAPTAMMMTPEETLRDDSLRYAKARKPTEPGNDGRTAASVPVLPLLAVVLLSFALVLTVALLLGERAPATTVVQEIDPTTEEALRPVGSPEATELDSARVRVHVRPWGKVSVDGGMEQEARPEVSFNLRPGEHTFVARDPQKKEQRKKVHVEAGENEPVTFDFRRKTE